MKKLRLFTGMLLTASLLTGCGLLGYPGGFSSSLNNLPGMDSSTWGNDLFPQDGGGASSDGHHSEETDGHHSEDTDGHHSEDTNNGDSSGSSVFSGSVSEIIGGGDTVSDEDPWGDSDVWEEETPQQNNTVAVNIPASEVTDQTVTFSVTDLGEKTVTQDIFSGYDLTIMHLWGTYCGPCVAEMGDYAKLYDSLPDNINLVGILCDVYEGSDENVDNANKILSDAGAGFENLRTNEEIYDLTSGFSFVPSCFFVDGQGRIVGEMMDGASFSAMMQRLNTYIQQ